MTENEKQLLLIDLCARFPYGVICKVVANDNPWIGDCKLRSYWLDKVTDTCYEVKPYLRPMSSMTEEEKKELNIILKFQYYSDDSCMCESTDWLNAHHFDYRGLIKKGLALEAKEGMYK